MVKIEKNSILYGYQSDRGYHRARYNEADFWDCGVDAIMLCVDSVSTQEAPQILLSMVIRPALQSHASLHVLVDRVYAGALQLQVSRFILLAPNRSTRAENLNFVLFMLHHDLFHRNPIIIQHTAKDMICSQLYSFFVSFEYSVEVTFVFINT